MLWQTGYPFRTSLASGTGRYDPVGNAAEKVLARGEVDFLLWVSSFDPDRLPPPPGRCQVVALTCAGSVLLPDAAVQIMVATPGIDQAGYLFRADKVVTLPLRASINRQLPAVAELARRFQSGLGVAAC
jgi:formylmethanofuran dehydrogenase subunit B